MLLTSKIFYNDYILRDFYCEGFIGNVFITKLAELVLRILDKSADKKSFHRRFFDHH